MSASAQPSSTTATTTTTAQQPNRANEIRVNVLGISLAAKTYGAITGIPVLALHGYLDNAATFDTLFALLPLNNPPLYIVCLELPGHGLSDHMPKVCGNYLLDWMHIIVHVVERLGWKKFGLIGHSMGGGICANLAGVYPDRVLFVVSLDSPLGPGSRRLEGGEKDSAVARMRMSLQQRPKLADFTPRVYETLEDAMKRSRRNFIYQQCSDKSLEILIRRSTVVFNNGLIFQHDPRIREDSFYSISEHEVLQFLAQIACPFLHFHCEEGWTWPHDPRIYEVRAANIKNFKKIIINGGHHAHLDKPELYIDHLTAFLKSFLPSSRSKL